MFKEKPERKQARLNLEEKQREEEKLDSALAKVRFYPGSQAEYESFTGHQVRVIDMGCRDIGVIFHSPDCGNSYRCLVEFEQKKTLVANGIEAIVGCSLGINQLGSFDEYIYGVPVAKK